MFRSRGISRCHRWSSCRRVVFPAAGTISKLYISVSRDPTPGTYTFKVYKNGIGQAVTCAVSPGNTSCNDTTHSFSVAQGDTVSLESVVSSSPLVLSNIQISLLFTSTTPGESIILGGSSAGLDTVNTHYRFIQGAGSADTVVTNRSVVMPTGGTISEMWIDLSSAPTSTNSFKFTLFQGGSATSQTCTVTGAATACNDTSHAVTITAGDLISIEMDPTGSPVGGTARWGFKWVPTTAGESVQLTGSSGSGTANTTTYSAANGQSSWNATESNNYQIGQACTLKKLYADYGTAPGGSLNRVLLQYFGLTSLIAQIRVNSNILYSATLSLPNQYRNKIAIAYKIGDSAVYVNGVKVVSNALTEDFTTYNLTNFAFNAGSASVSQFHARTNQALVFKTRLSDTDLATLTTL